MGFIEQIVSYFNKYFSISEITVTDVIEILFIAVLFYEVMIWFKKTRAWALLKGIIIILVIVLLAAIFQLTTILWIAKNTLSVGIIGLIIIFQPELRRALERLGRGRLFTKIFGNAKNKNLLTEQTLEEIVEAVDEMSKRRTGALICLEKDVSLGEYENTGIRLDSEVSRQLLVNIFVDKTPLHDGAVIVRNDRIVAATCYLPMSDNLSVSKQYGTRHRAALGLSEVSDALTIVVSEETGDISVTERGVLYEQLSHADLRNKMIVFQTGQESERLPLIKKLRKEAENDEI